MPRDADGDLPVYVMAYPMPVKAGGCWWTLLSAGDHDFIRAFVDDLNDTVQAVAEEHGFTFVAGGGVVVRRRTACGSATATRPRGLGMNFIALNPVSGRLIDVVNPKNWIHNSFHPNEIGHEAMRETVRGGAGRATSSAPTSRLRGAVGGGHGDAVPDGGDADGEPSGEDAARAVRPGDLRLGVVADAAAGARRRCRSSGSGSWARGCCSCPLIRRAQQEQWSLLTLLPGRRAQEVTRSRRRNAASPTATRRDGHRGERRRAAARRSGSAGSAGVCWNGDRSMQPGGQVEQGAEHADHEARDEGEPRTDRPAGHQPEEGQREAGEQPHGRDVGEGGADAAAAPGPSRRRRRRTPSPSPKPPAASVSALPTEGRDEVAARPRPSRGRRGQHGLGALRRSPRCAAAARSGAPGRRPRGP